MRYRVEFAPRALFQARQAHDWIAERSLERAAKWYQKLLEKVGAVSVSREMRFQPLGGERESKNTSMSHMMPILRGLSGISNKLFQPKKLWRILGCSPMERRKHPTTTSGGRSRLADTLGVFHGLRIQHQKVETLETHP